MNTPTDKALAWLEKWYPREGQMHAPGAENWDKIVSMWEWDLKWGEGDKDRMTFYMLRALAKWSRNKHPEHAINLSAPYTTSSDPYTVNVYDTRRGAEVVYGSGETEFSAALAAVEAAAESE